MSTARDATNAEMDVDLVTIRRAMNEHGTLTVEVAGVNATRHIVEYASADLRSTLAELPPGTTISLSAEPVGFRGNAWRATGLGNRP